MPSPIGGWPGTFRLAWTQSRSRPAAVGAVLSQQCPQLLQAQTGNGALPTAIHSCITTIAKTFDQTLVYQPANRYWPFQWAELGLFLALAGALAAFSACGLRCG